MTYSDTIAVQIGIRPGQASAAIELLDSGNTLPFIARYRKEATGSLDDDQLRKLVDLLEHLRALDERRDTILKSIEEQGKLTPELKAEILAAGSLTRLEDLYLPYKPKKRTRASIARELGLQGLADLIIQQPRTRQTLDELAKPFLSEMVPSVDDAWQGARDIVAESVSDDADIRRVVREKTFQWGSLSSEKIEDAVDEQRMYEVYYALDIRVDRLRPHQVLAINRGEGEKVLRVRVVAQERDWRTAVGHRFRVDPISPLKSQLEMAIDDAAERLLLPAIERDIRRQLTETAELHAIHVFAGNLRALLLQPPLLGHTVLGLDPGFRTGTKCTVIDPTGRVLETGTIYPHEPQNRKKESLLQMAVWIKQYQVTLIAIGNGTASRETEQLVAELIRGLEDPTHPDLKQSVPVRYMITNEAGASVYSASPLAREELPGMDVSLRGAVSIARRVQDPLAELVKIDPKSIGVGLYQHDVDQKQLAYALHGVVEYVVNTVGVDVNTASPALLTHVAGIGPALAVSIVAYRNETGAFKRRADLKKVPRLGPKAYEQAAGFLRVRGSDEPLDASAIHPESYSAAKKVLEWAGTRMDAPVHEREQAIASLRSSASLSELAAEFGVGEATLTDIFEQIARPGRDPRLDAPAPILRSDVLKMEDLATGMRLKGTVRNVVDFGAFVDIGVKQDGLLHRTMYPQGTVLQVGNVIDVEIVKIETERGRIGLKLV